MIKITETLALTPINIDDQPILFRLMQHVYPQSYEHLWTDGGTQYVQSLYNPDNLAKELAEPQSLYCFVEYDAAIVGILRVLDNAPLVDLANETATKLQRIYLDAGVQGKGLGKILMNWVTQRAIKQGKAIMWLEAMDSQESAVAFYEKQGFSISGKQSLKLDLMHQHLRGMYRMWKPVVQIL